MDSNVPYEVDPPQQVYVMDLVREIREKELAIQDYRSLVEALDNLLCAYRLHRRPSDRTLDSITRLRAVLYGK